MTPYRYAFNNPVNVTDPTGMLEDDDKKPNFEYTDGYGTYSSRGVTSSINFNGAYNAVGGDDPKKKGKPAPKNSLPTSTVADPTQSKDPIIQGGLGLATALALDDVSGVGVADDPLIPIVLAATAIYAAVSTDYVAKLQEELGRLIKKAAGPQGYTYALLTTVPGDYNVYSYGFSNPTGKIQMGSGEIWKIGESTGKDRYTAAYLKQEKVQLVPVYFGNQLEIKIKEKFLIYGYFFINGKLPPGNKMFK